MTGRQMLEALAQMASTTASVRGNPRRHEGTGISPRAPTRGTDDDVFPATRRAADGGGGGPWSSGPLIIIMPPPNETRFDRSRGSGLPEQSVMSEPEGLDIPIYSYGLEEFVAAQTPFYYNYVLVLAHCANLRVLDLSVVSRSISVDFLLSRLLALQQRPVGWCKMAAPVTATAVMPRHSAEWVGVPVY